jgi:hypothetical protein
LLGAHVLRRADDGPELGEERAFGQPLVDGLGDAEIDDLGDGLAVVERDQDVGRFDVAVDDALLVGVLDGLADRDEQLQPLPGVEPVLVAILGDRHPLDQLHHEVGPAGLGGAGIQHAGNIGVVHQRQGLAFGLEPGDDLVGVHARLDDLQRHAASDRVFLLGHEHGAHPTLADLLEQLVGTDTRAGSFTDRAWSLGHGSGDAVSRLVGVGGVFCTRLFMSCHYGLDLTAKLLIMAAGLIEEGGALDRIGFFQSSGEDRFFSHGRVSWRGGFPRSPPFYTGAAAPRLRNLKLGWPLPRAGVGHPVTAAALERLRVTQAGENDTSSEVLNPDDPLDQAILARRGALRVPS